MNTETVTPAETTGQPDPFAEVAAELHRVADDVATLAGSGLPKPRFQLNIQPGGRGDNELTVRSVDALANALLGHPGQIQKMNNGTYHYSTDYERRGPLEIAAYQSVDPEWAEERYAASQLAAREAELEKLRAEVEELRKQAGR